MNAARIYIRSEPTFGSTGDDVQLMVDPPDGVPVDACVVHLVINDNYFGRSWEAEIGRFVDGARGV